MKKLQAIIFDVDGTLANTDRDGHLIAFNDTFKAQNLDWHWNHKLYGELLSITGGKERMRFYIDQYNASFDGNDSDIAELHRLKTNRYIELLDTGIIPLRVGVKNLIETARKNNIILAISTTTSFPNIEALLKNQLSEDAMDWFSAIGSADDATIKKPAPDVYNFVMDELKIPRSNCIAIEDSRNGVLSAKAAGLSVVVTTNEYTENDDLSGANLIVDQIGTADNGFKVLAGDNFNDSYLTLNLLDQLLIQNEK